MIMLRTVPKTNLSAVRPLSCLLNSKVIAVESPHSHVYHVKLNRPEARNAFVPETWSDLKNTFEYLNELKECRAIVISGEGQTFSAGIDLKSGITAIFQLANDDELDVARKAFTMNKFIKAYQNAFLVIEKTQKPVICAVHGHCLGAGISLAASCDIRYSTNNAVFSVKEVDVGLAADVGVLQRLQKICGNDSWAREVSFTARNFSGSEALDKGFVSRTFDDATTCLDSALKLAVQIASKSPVAVQGTKLAMNYSRDHSVEDSLEWMRNWNQAHLQSEDLQRIAFAMMKKEKPTFNDL